MQGAAKHAKLLSFLLQATHFPFLCPQEWVHTFFWKHGKLRCRHEPPATIISLGHLPNQQNRSLQAMVLEAPGVKQTNDYLFCSS